MVAETRIGVDDLIAPLFVREGISEPQPILSMPGVVQHSVSSLVREAERLVDLKVPAIVLFGIPAEKDEVGSGASDPDGICQVALRALRSAVGDELVLIPDLCLDEYTAHGHCGLLDGDGEVDNDSTLVRYAEIAVAQGDAGADLVAPSGMMDGQVATIRAALDAAGQEIGRYIPKQMAEAKATEMTLANAYADCIGPVSTVRDGIRLRLRTQFLDQHALEIRQLTMTIERVVSRLSAEYGVTPGS